MNFASDDQLTAVGQSCRDYESQSRNFISSIASTTAENISCKSCEHWNGAICTIDVFDKVLTSLDQT